MEELTSKGKHTVNIGNYLHTNMISKPAIVRKAQVQDIGNAFEIKDQQLNTILFFYIDCYSKTSW